MAKAADRRGKAGEAGARKDGGARKGVRCASKRPNRRTSRTAFAGDEPEEEDPLLGFAPYEHRAPRRNLITPDRQRAFIAALAASGIVTQAARRIGASLEALYKLRNRAGAEGFAQAWDAAVDRGMARLEDCALERAIAGEERLVMHEGAVVATWRRYDTQLLVFLLRNRRRERYDAGVPSLRALRGGGRGSRGPWWSSEEARQQAIEEEAEAEAVLEGLNRKLEGMRQNWLAARGLRDEDEDGDDPASP